MATKNRFTGRIAIVFLLAFLFLLPGRESVHAADGWMQEKKPYQYTDATEYLAGQENYFTIGGTNYDEGYVFYLWNGAGTSQVLYNLKGEYSNFSFKVGHIDNETMYTAKLKIYLDGELTDTVDLSPSDIAKQVSVNVDKVKNLKIKMETDEPLNHYDIYYGVYNGVFTKNGTVSDQIPASNMVGSKEPYQVSGEKTKVIYAKDKQSILMGGDTFTDCLQMYLWNPAGNSQFYFNFGGEYKSMTFLFGHIDNTRRAGAALDITLDGELKQTVAVQADDLPTPVTVPLENVHQMVLSLTCDAPLNTYDIFYGIGAIQLKSMGYVKGISLNTNHVTLTAANPSVRLSASVLPNDAVNQNYSWSSSNESVATVDQAGVVRAVSKGTATITAKTEEGGYTADCLITVDLPDKQAPPTPPGNQGQNQNTDGSSAAKPEKAPSVQKVKSLKAKGGKKSLTVTWKKLSNISGYQIQVSGKKNFKGASTKGISKSKQRYVIRKLKSSKKFFVRIRAYKTYKNAAGKTVKAYGKWASVSKKTK